MLDHQHVKAATVTAIPGGIRGQSAPGCHQVGKYSATVVAKRVNIWLLLKFSANSVPLPLLIFLEKQPV